MRRAPHVQSDREIRCHRIATVTRPLLRRRVPGAYPSHDKLLPFRLPQVPRGSCTGRIGCRMRALSNRRELAAFHAVLLAVLSDSSTPMTSGERARDNLAGSLGGLRRGAILEPACSPVNCPIRITYCIKPHSNKGGSRLRLP